MGMARELETRCLRDAIAMAHPLVIKDPPPQAFLTDLTGGTLHFELRAWTNQAEDWFQTRSELATGIYSALVQQNIPLK